MPRLFLLDNMDSFTFNLAQAFMKLGADVRVERAADTADWASRVAEWNPTSVVLSPGPKRPADHPANFALLEAFAGKCPVLGVCLGMQAINEWCGGTLRRETPPMHGKTSAITYAPGAPLLAGLPNPFTAARYHSLVVDRLGRGLHKIAWTHDGSPLPLGRGQGEGEEAQQCIMAFTHERLPIYGVQFHPESYLTPEGTHILRAFLCNQLK